MIAAVSASGVPASAIVGCYKDNNNSNDHDLNGRYTKSDNTTQESCAADCFANVC